MNPSEKILLASGGLIVLAIVLFLLYLWIDWENEIYYKIFLTIIALLILLATILFIVYWIAFEKDLKFKFSKLDRPKKDPSLREPPLFGKYNFDPDTPPETRSSNAEASVTPSTESKASSTPESIKMSPKGSVKFNMDLESYEESPVVNLKSGRSFKLFNDTLEITPSIGISGKNMRCFYHAISHEVYGEQKHWGEIRKIIFDQNNVRDMYNTNPEMLCEHFECTDLDGNMISFEEFYRKLVSKFRDGCMGDGLFAHIIAKTMNRDIILIDHSRGNFNVKIFSKSRGYVKDLDGLSSNQNDLNTVMEYLQTPKAIKIYRKGSHFEIFNYKLEK